MKLIPREILYGNPESEHASESPDGRLVTYMAPVNNVMNIFAGPLDNLSQIKPITNDTGRGIHTYGWMWDSRTILYAQNINGDENWTI
jgi:hypothetical protein